MIKEWLNNLSQRQKWILYAGFALTVVITVIHNPFSGYRKSSSGIYTRDPIGESPDNRFNGYLKLGTLSAYGSFVIAIFILTAAAVHLSDSKDD